jgi:uncharacterized protein with PQ loop repeat
MEYDWVQDTFGWAAAALTLFFIITPIIPFYNVIKGKLNFEDTPGQYITANYLNYFCWYLYGDLLYSFQLKYCNLVGTIVSGILLSIYLYYEVKKYTADAILNGLILVSGTYLIYVTLTNIIDDDKIIGTICIVTYLIVLAFPARIIIKVLRNKNYYIIQFCSSWLSMLISSCWVIYGVLYDEIYIVFPHIIKIILDMIQITIFVNYRRKYPSIRIGDKEDMNGTSSTVFENNDNDIITKKEDSENKGDDDANSNLKEKPVKIVEKMN